MKRFLLIMLSAAMLALAVGCSKEETTSDKPQNSPDQTRKATRDLLEE